MNLVAPSMLIRLATPLRILMLVMTFLMASAGHHVAVAADPETHGMHTVVTLDGGHHHGADHSCRPDGCGDPSTDCCIMGQCMLAVPVPAIASLRLPTTPVLVAARGFALADAAPILPFRPPVDAEA